MARKIIKIALTGDQKAHVEYEERNPGQKEPDKHKLDRPCFVHPDLIAALDKLKAHMATVCEQYLLTEFEDNPALLDKFSVDGITIKGEGEHEGVVISGTRHVANNLAVTMNTPFIKFNANHSFYQYSEEMMELVRNVETEIEAYLNGKFGAGNQYQMFSEDSIEQQEGKMVLPKKRGGRKQKEVVEVEQEQREHDGDEVAEN